MISVMSFGFLYYILFIPNPSDSNNVLPQDTLCAEIHESWVSFSTSKAISRSHGLLQGLLHIPTGFAFHCHTLLSLVLKSGTNVSIYSKKKYIYKKNIAMYLASKETFMSRIMIWVLYLNVNQTR